ncbi:MAG: hypothetical protein ABIM50_07590 [Novosphingobium sp.]
MLKLLQTISAWFYALPAPTQHFATVLSAWAWPSVVLIIAYFLRNNLGKIAEALAERMRSDHIKVGNFLEMTRNTNVIPLDEDAVADEIGHFGASGVVTSDVKVIERILEFVGEGEANAYRLMDWIAANVDPNLDPVDFLGEPHFANDRKAAYNSLIGD